MGKFEGILFTLKKRIENIESNDNNLYKYLVMGYYDGLDIHVVDNWYEMRPRGLRERNLQVNISSPFVDQYTMRAFFPQNRQELEEKGFSYSLWEEIGKTELTSFRKEITEARKHIPYICMSVINIATPSLLGNDLSRVPGELESRILEAANHANISLSEQHCAVFPSIGYADYIVLFLTDDLSKVSQILSGLRREKNAERAILISGIYSVCGMDSSGFESDTSCPDVRIALYINLREGMSVGNFIHGLDEEKKRAKSNNMQQSYLDELENLREEVEKNVYLTFGYTDSMIVLYKPLNIYKELYAENHILNPGHEFFKKYIGNIRTSVRMQEKQIKPEKGPESSSQINDMQKKYFQDFIDKYSNFLEKNDFPIRSAIGLKQIMKHFLNITSLSRSFDVAVVLGDAFDALINAVTYYMEKKSVNLFQTVAEDEEISEYYREKIRREQKETVEAVKLYKDSIGDFIADLMRSDCAFIEGNTLSHPAIGSATKLLFSYTEILNSLARKKGEAERLQFIVISGGCDQTEAEDLFSFASPDENKNIKKLIIISIPEMSLYDVRGTLFRSLHECMHFIGDRRRKLRYECLVDALAEYIAYDIVDMKFTEELLKRYIKCASVGCTENLKEEIAKLFEKHYRENKECAENNIADKIRNYKLYVSYAGQKEDSYFHRREIIKNVFDPILFSEESNGNGEKKLREQICKILCKCNQQILIEFYNILYKLYEPYTQKKENQANKNQYSLQNSSQLFHLLMQQYQNEILQKEYDNVTMKYIIQYFETFLYYIEHPNLTMDIHYSDLISAMISAMVESYSDCTAISLTGMKVEDFLLSFIYEVWDIEHAFPLVVKNYLRIGADLKVMYGIEGSLSDEIKDKIRKRVENIAFEGYVYKHTENMLEKIDIILKRYQDKQLGGIQKNLEKYIRDVVKNNQDTEFSELKEIYGRCSFKSDTVYESISVMLEQWRKIGETSDEG